MDFGPQYFRNSGWMSSGPCGLPVLICLMVGDNFLMGKGAEKEVLTLGAFQRLVHSSCTRRAWALYASLNFPLKLQTVAGSQSS